MKTKHTIIYIPGLGDHNLTSQQRALNLWRVYGVNVEICPVNWFVNEPWDTKLQRILDRIDIRTKQGSKVSLIGISAGSTAALQAFAARRSSVHKVALVCAKFQYPETVHPMRYKMNPSLKTAIDTTVSMLPTLTPADKQKIRSYRALYDNLLPARETKIPGVKNKVMLAITHVGGIAHALTVCSWDIVLFLRSATRTRK